MMKPTIVHNYFPVPRRKTVDVHVSWQDGAPARDRSTLSNFERWYKSGGKTGDADRDAELRSLQTRLKTQYEAFHRYAGHPDEQADIKKRIAELESKIEKLVEGTNDGPFSSWLKQHGLSFAPDRARDAVRDASPVEIEREYNLLRAASKEYLARQVAGRLDPKTALSAPKSDLVSQVLWSKFRRADMEAWQKATPAQRRGETGDRTVTMPATFAGSMQAKVEQAEQAIRETAKQRGMSLAEAAREYLARTTFGSAPTLVLKKRLGLDAKK